MPPPVVVLSGRHRPHEVLLAVWSLVFGLSSLLGAPQPGSITALIPRWEIVAWSGGLALSGAVGLAALAVHRRWPLGSVLRLEAGGQLLGAGALLVYIAAAFSLGGWRALFAGGLVAAWCAANVWRAWQIRRDLRSVRWTS